MNESVSKFLEKIATLSPSLTLARNGTIDYWLPDEPPVTIAFAELAPALVEEIITTGSDAREPALLMIEEGISSSDEELSTAVATGLVEGMVGYAAKLGTYPDLLAHLGPNSKLHAQAWHDG